MSTNRSEWRDGMRDGVPIALGYFAVAFTFGIVARNTGLTALESTAMSATNLTSAGQFAALELIGSSSGLLLMALTQLVINLRYALMSAAISQKLDPAMPFYHRLLIAYGVTDEIFGVSVTRPGRLNPFYSYGLISVAMPGWSLGTYVGVVAGDVLPERLLSALGIAIYGMFIAVVIPPAKGDRRIALAVGASMLLSLAVAEVPQLARLFERSGGIKVIALTLLIAGAAALLDPKGGQRT